MLSALLALFGIYLLAGAVFAPCFALAGVERIDPVSRGASAGFRLMLLPGATILWPMLAHRWIRASRHDRVQVAGDRIGEWSPRSERLRWRALLMWLVMGPLMVVAVLLALVARPSGETRSIDADRLTAERAP